jgi:hypothetical protein
MADMFLSAGLCQEDVHAMAVTNTMALVERNSVAR